MLSDKNDFSIKQISYCLSIHFASYQDIDAIIKTIISDILNHSESKWIPGNFWLNSSFEDINKFTSSFDREVNDFDKYYEGIQTRSIGSLILDASVIIKNDFILPQSIISFRKLHDGYLVMFFIFSKEINNNLKECIELFNLLKLNTDSLIEFVFKNSPEKFKNNFIGPPTVFYIINNITKKVDLEILFSDSSSSLSSFLKTYFCSKGVKYHNIHRASVGSDIFLIRHPSYHFFYDLNEKFLLIPEDLEIPRSSLFKTVDIFSSIEYYYTSFLRFIRATNFLTEEIDKKTQQLFPLFNKTRLPSLSPKETNQILDEITETSKDLFPKYPTADKAIEEAEHMFSDATYLISGIVSPSSYSQIIEKRLSPIIEGVAESIGKEMQMRLHHLRNFLPRALGRSYNKLTNATNLIRAHYELILNKTMVNYTSQIKQLTIVIVILTLITMLFSLVSIYSKIKDFIIFF